MLPGLPHVLGPATPAPRARFEPDVDPPEGVADWILVPLWLHAAWAGEAAGARPDPGLVDLLVAQQALFVCIRVQDDLLDGHITDLTRQFEADRCLLAALDLIQGVPGLGPAFARKCRARVRDTIDAILEVERLYRTPGAFTAAHLPLHARVAAIFGVATAGVCQRLRRTRELRWIGPLQDAIAVADQLLDDLEDAGRDAGEGRFTYVVNALLGDAAGEAGASHLEAVAEGLLDPARLEPVWDALRSTAARAAAVLPAHAPSPARELVRAMTRTAREAPARAHEARVRWVFGEHFELARPGS